jgi:hypothetical protein
LLQRGVCKLSVLARCRDGISGGAGNSAAESRSAVVPGRVQD